MRNLGLIITAICLVLTFSSSTRGAEMPIASTLYLIHLNTGPSAFLDTVNKDAQIYNDCPIRKAGDGAMNALSSWTDIPTEVAYQTQDSNILLGLTVGLGRGIVFGVARGTAGLVDVGTSPFPPYDKPLMEPEYTVKNPDQDGFKIALLEW
ncbi:MAG: exosortase system-associated protein, TIGR04073 family [Candidatus Omnitrophota bacterium]